MHVFLSLALSSWLGLEPPPLAATYEQACTDLESATHAMADVEPEAAIASLEAAIAAVAEHPSELLRDAATQEAIRRARVSLAWLHLARGDRAAAGAAMDEALRGAGGSPLPLSGLGPDIGKLHDERLAALESAGTATITVDCEACDVLVDEHPAATSSEHYLGTHRVWLFDSLGTLEPRFEVVTLDTVDAVATLVYRAAPQVSEPVEPPPPPPEPGLNPRTAKIVGGVTLGLGVGLVGGGGVLFALDDGAVGATLTAFGVALVATGVTLLVVQAVQTKRAKPSKSGKRALRVAPHGFGVAF